MIFEAIKDENINVALRVSVVIYWKHLNVSETPSLVLRDGQDEIIITP